jgi:aspartate/methionine/tyrosine aminotransferase
MSSLFASRKASSFTESVIREMTRLAAVHDAVNLGQGFPDFPAPDVVKDAARLAIAEDRNQYPITWGSKELRDALARAYERWYGMTLDPETDICVTCGSTEAMIDAMLATLNEGDEIVVFEPFYENYNPDAILAGVTPRHVTLRAPDWSFDEGELRAAFGDRTRAIVINSPNNPTGKVFTRDELMLIGSLCERYDATAITDEIYEHITYDGAEHIPIATIPGMEDRTITISALSKTYAVTGWRVGWAVGARRLIGGIRAVHVFVPGAAATPLQHAGVTALELPADYYERIRREYAERRSLMLAALDETGFEATSPAGAYYVMADISHLGLGDDVETAHHLVEREGVAVVPGSSFFSHPKLGSHLVRFAFCKRLETLEAAAERLRALVGVA